MHKSPVMTMPYILIGASAGGVYAMLALAAALPADFPAPIFFVQHIGAHRSQLAELLTGRGPNRAVEGEDGQQPEPGTIYIAPPDRHMLIEGGRIRLTRGPKEHHARPAIDPLFRSAALDMGPRIVGVILTGMLDDGSAGLRAVKECGGITVVQDPDDAFEPSMPRAAIAATAVDHVVPMSALAALLLELARPVVVAQDPAAKPVPAAMRMEHQISFGDQTMEELKTIATPSTFSCPDCGGVLFELDGMAQVRFRCHTGHAFSLRTLMATLEPMTDVVLWAAVRTLREKEGLLRRMAVTGGGQSPAECLQEAGDLALSIAALRRHLLSTNDGRVPGDA